MSYFNLSVQRMRVLSELAEYYAESYCPGSLLTDPEQIADKLGITICKSNYNKAFDGMLCYREGNFYLHLNVHEDAGEHIFMPRIRFTFAHELGHYIIDEHRNALKLPGVSPHPSFPLVSQDSMIEREADHFAACLLLPENRIKKDVFRKKFNAALINEISTKYNVSHTATLLRFIALGNHPIMIVCSRNGTIVWHRETYDFPFTFPLYGHKGRVPENTSAGEYFYENKKNQNRAEIVFAGDWFSVKYKTDQNRKFLEYCYYFDGMNQVVSVIWED
jgi:Zn-dependent peptidase ImmA (M78 family)